MAALQYVDIPGYAALLLRRTYPELEGAEGLIARAHLWLARTEAVWNEQKKRYTFPSGAVLQFGHVKEETDKYRYQGQAFQFVGFDELTHFTESQYEYIAFTRSRRGTELAERGVPIRARSASNPGNIGHGWVKSRFIDRPTEGTIFVPAKVADNPGLDVADYAASLAHVPDELRRQLLDGDWDAFEGKAFPAFGTEHLIDEFPLGDAHDRLEAMDYGLNGTAWYLIPTDFDGNVIFFDELAEANLLPDEVAPLVIERRKGEWGFGHNAFADPTIWHRTGGRRAGWNVPATIATEFEDAGVQVVPANNDPRAGLIRLRTLMELDPERRFPDWHPRRGEHGAPRMFIARRCVELIKALSDAPLQPIGKPDGGEKIDPEWESRYGHSCASARYGVMSRPGPSTEPEQQPQTPHELAEQAARKMLERLQREDYTYV